MEYSELLKNIEDWLASRNWIKESTTDNSTFTRSSQRTVGEMIINGQKQVQIAEIKETLKHEGEGYIEDDNGRIILSQWNYTIGANTISFLIEKPEDILEYTGGF